MIQKHVSWGLVISASDSGDFDDCIDPIFLKRDITIERLVSLFQRQTLAASIFRKANNIKILQTLFVKTMNENERAIVHMIKKDADKIISRIRSDTDLTKSEQIKSAQKIEKSRDKELVKFYKTIISRNYDKYKHMNLNEDERYSIRYLYFCPNIVIVFDDCASKINKWLKDKKYTIIKDMFYNGRWYYMTHIYMIQEEKELDTLIRKNVFVSVFCNDISATTFWEKTSSGLPRNKKKRCYGYH